MVFDSHNSRIKHFMRTPQVFQKTQVHQKLTEAIALVMLAFLKVSVSK